MTRVSSLAYTGAVALILIGGGLIAGKASADTPDCASHPEYNDLQPLMTRPDVTELFDIGGRYDGDTDHGDSWRQAYRTCWDPDATKIIIVFDYASGLSLRWHLEDL